MARYGDGKYEGCGDDRDGWPENSPDHFRSGRDGPSYNAWRQQRREEAHHHPRETTMPRTIDIKSKRINYSESGFFISLTYDGDDLKSLAPFGVRDRGHDDKKTDCIWWAMHLAARLGRDVHVTGDVAFILHVTDQGTLEPGEGVDLKYWNYSAHAYDGVAVAYIDFDALAQQTPTLPSSLRDRRLGIRYFTYIAGNTFSEVEKVAAAVAGAARCSSSDIHLGADSRGLMFHVDMIDGVTKNLEENHSA